MMQIKKLTQKDRHGNMTSVEFEVPPMQDIPHPGGPKGTDTVPAWLTPGENVINAEASRLPGVQPMLDKLNDAGRVIQAQQGGPVPTYAEEGKKIPVPVIPEGFNIRSNVNPNPIDSPDYELSPYQTYQRLVAGGMEPDLARGYVGNFMSEAIYDKDNNLLNFGSFQMGGGPGRGVAQWGGQAGILPRKTHPYDSENPVIEVEGNRYKWNPTANVDGKGAYVYDRFENLKDFAMETNREWRDPQTQIDFILNEEKETQSVYNKIKSAGLDPNDLTTAQAAEFVMANYERPATYLNRQKNPSAFNEELVERINNTSKVPPLYDMLIPEFVYPYAPNFSDGGQIPSPEYYVTGTSGSVNPTTSDDSDDKEKSFLESIGSFFFGKDEDEKVVPTPPASNTQAPPVVTAPVPPAAAPVPPAAAPVPPVVTPPAAVEQPADAGEVGVNDTIIRNGVPYIYDSEKDEYVDAEGREYSRSPGEFIGDIFEGLSRLGEESIGPPADSTLVGKIKNEGIVGPEFYDVYRTENGDFIKIGYGGVRERLSSVMGTEDDIIFIDESQRSTVPPATEGLVPLPDGTPGTTPDTSQGVQTLDDTDDGDIEGAANQGADQDPGAWEKAKTWVADNFGYLKDDKLLARMAVQYFGSRVLGYDHLTSARYAAKDYMTELDEKLDKTPLGIKKRGGRTYHTQIGVLPTVIGTDDIERVNIEGQLLRLDDPRIAPYLEDYQESQHDRDNIKKAFRTDGLTYLKEVNANRESEDQVPEALSVRISDEADTLFNTRKFGYGGLGAQQRADLISNLNLAMSDYYRDYAAWIDDGKKDGRKPSSLQAYFQKRQINIDTGGAWSNSDIEGTNARTFAKIDKQIKDKAWESSNENPKRAMELYQFNMAKYKSTWTKYTAMAAQGKNVPTVFLNAGGEGMNPMMNWINECLSGNKKALEIFKLVKQ